MKHWEEIEDLLISPWSHHLNLILPNGIKVIGKLQQVDTMNGSIIHRIFPSLLAEELAVIESKHPFVSPAMLDFYGRASGMEIFRGMIKIFGFHFERKEGGAVYPPDWEYMNARFAFFSSQNKMNGDYYVFGSHKFQWNNETYLYIDNKTDKIYESQSLEDTSPRRMWETLDEFFLQEIDRLNKLHDSAGERTFKYEGE